MTDWKDFLNQRIEGPEGSYVLELFLGNGGFAGVYQVRNELAPHSPKRALKLIESTVTQVNQDLAELVRALKLDHPYLIRTFDAGMTTFQNRPFLFMVMELAESSLAVRLRAGQLSGADTELLGAQVASALSYLHGEPIKLVHRDLKPDNLLFAGGVWKLADFGIARRLIENAQRTQTIKGTLPYMPPESIEGQDSLVSPAWDLWSLGIVLAEAFSGYLAFPKQVDPLVAIYAAKTQEPKLDPELPPVLAEVIRGCLQKNPASRWTAAQVLNHLNRPAPLPPVPPVRRTRAGAFATAFVALAGLTWAGSQGVPYVKRWLTTPAVSGNITGKARELLLKGRYEDAERLLREAVAKDPSLQYQRYLAFALEGQDQTGEAERTLTAAVQDGDRDLAGRVVLARLMSASSSSAILTRAEELASQAVEMGGTAAPGSLRGRTSDSFRPRVGENPVEWPNLAGAYRVRCVVRQRLNRPDEAKADCEQAHVLDPEAVDTSR